MNEVWSFMYSPADLPSRWRAAPAKKRIWSTMAGISSAMVTATGLPVFSHSTRTRSSARASRASAIRKRARLRSDGVASRHSGKAAAAAAMARSMSLAPETGASRYSSPVLGSTIMAPVPSVVSTYRPPTKLDSLRRSVDPRSGPLSLTHPSPGAGRCTGSASPAR